MCKAKEANRTIQYDRATHAAFCNIATKRRKANPELDIYWRDIAREAAEEKIVKENNATN